MITGIDENPFITTATGVQFHILAPSSLEIRIVDIAIALSRVPRFAGHTSEPWVVAQHCLLVAGILRQQGFNTKMQMAGLLHDAAEAYICDVPSPLKWAMEQKDGKDCAYRQIEREVERAINEALQPEWIFAPDYARKAVKKADQIALRTEAKAYIVNDAQWTVDGAEPLPYGPTTALDSLRIKLGLKAGMPVDGLYLSVYDRLLEEEVGF